MKNVELKIEGMHCEGCSKRIEKILNNMEGITKAEVILEEKKAKIEYKETEVSIEQIKKEIEEAGFKVN